MAFKSIDAGQIKAELILDGKKFKAGLKTAKGLGRKFAKEQELRSKAVRKAWGIAFLGIGAAATLAAIGLNKFTAAGRDLEAELANVSTLGNFTAESMASMKEEVLDLSSEIRKSPVDLARGLYQAISAGAEAGAEAINVLTVSAKFATAGLTSTEVAVNAITNAINAYGKENLSAERASNLMFKTIQKGKTTAEELAPQLGKVTGMAANLGIRFEEVSAATAQLTKTMPTPIAMTALGGAFQGLAKNADKFKEAGVDIFDVIKEDGLTGALRELQKLTGGNIEELKEFIPDMRALRGVLSLTGDQLGDYNAMLKVMEDQTDVVTEAVGKQMDTTKSKTAGLKVAFNNLSDTLAVKLKGSYESFIEYSTNALNVINAMIEAEKKQDPVLARPEFQNALGITDGKIRSMTEALIEQGTVEANNANMRQAELRRFADLEKQLTKRDKEVTDPDAEFFAFLDAQNKIVNAFGDRSNELRRFRDMESQLIDRNLAADSSAITDSLNISKLSTEEKLNDRLKISERAVQSAEKEMALDDGLLAREIANEETRIALADARIAKQDEEADRVIKKTKDQAKSMEDFNQGIWDSLGAGWAESTAGFLAQAKGWKEETFELREVMDGVWDDLKKKAIATMIELVGKQLIQAAIAAAGWAPAAALSATATGGGSAVAAKTSLGSLFSFVNSFLPSRREGGPVMQGPVMVHDNEFVLSRMQTTELSSLLTNLNAKVDNLGSGGGNVVVKASDGSSPLVRLLIDEINFEVEENNVRSIASGTV